MSTKRDQNGPTQVHASLNYTDLFQINGLNGLNGIGTMNKHFGESGKHVLLISIKTSRVVLRDKCG